MTSVGEDEEQQCPNAEEDHLDPQQPAQRPLWYLRRIFYDSVSYHPPALRLLAETVGVDRILFGTDYPHVIGDVPRVIATLDAAGFSREELDAISRRNAKEGLGLDLP